MPRMTVQKMTLYPCWVFSKSDTEEVRVAAVREKVHQE